MDKEFNFIKRKHILIVDDERQLLDLIESILREDGFSSITTAGSAQEAIVACHTSFPDLAILDVNLPDRDGFSLMKDIRQIKDIPILFLTARDKPEGIVHGTRCRGRRLHDQTVSSQRTPSPAERHSSPIIQK